MRKAVVGGAVLAVVGLLLLWDRGVPLIPGRAPTASETDPVGLPPGGPNADLGAFQVLVSPVALAPVGSQDPGPAAGLRARVAISVRDLRAAVDAEADGRDGMAELDLDGGEARSGLQDVLASVLLVLIVLEAARGQHRDRRQPAAVPASAA